MHKLLAAIPCDASEGMAKVCKETGLEEENLQQWTKKVIDKIWSLVWEDVEARNVLINNIMWRSTDFHRYAVEETGGRGSHHVHLCL